MIPEPPGGEIIVKGRNKSMDAFVKNFLPAMRKAVQEEHGQVEKVTTYTADASVEDIIEFYQEEMTNLGWQELPIDEGVFAAIAGLGFELEDKGVVFIIIDMGQLLSSGTLVIMVNVAR